MDHENMSRIVAETMSIMRTGPWSTVFPTTSNDSQCRAPFSGLATGCWSCLGEIARALNLGISLPHFTWDHLSCNSVGLYTNIKTWEPGVTHYSIHWFIIPEFPRFPRNKSDILHFQRHRFVMSTDFSVSIRITWGMSKSKTRVSIGMVYLHQGW